MLQILRLSFLKAPLGLLVAALLLTAAVQPIAPTAALAAAEMPYGHGLLWRVQRDAGPVSYVLGTMHSTDPRLRSLPPEIDRAIDESRVMAFELLESQQGNEKMAQAMQLPAGRRLQDVIGPELFQRTTEALAPLGIPAAGLQGFKPWALSLFLIFPPIEVVRQAQGEPAYDNWLQAEGRRRGKALQALESHEEQIEIFDGMSEAEQTAMVTDMLADYANIEAHFNRMFRAYLKGDITVLMEAAGDISGVSDVGTAQRLQARLIDDRNRVMAARILPLLRDGGAFIAIGAAHLPGDDGVLARLEARGYRITRAY
ncbi:MAG: TraB/GumN family protein [Kiloniellaceae bacterium]